MKVNNKVILSVAISGMFLAPVTMAADTLSEALSSGKAYGDFRLRYEGVEQDNASKDASALTLRTQLGYTTGVINGFSGTIEFEDVSVAAGMDEYGGDYSVVADPETTELDQFFVQYKTDKTTSKLGSQVITLDGHRFVGHVGWRQDRQTFDAFTFNAKPSDKIDLSYAYITKRNRIFAEVADIKSKDHLLNGSLVTPAGKITAYGYFLEVDNDTDNALDTVGVSFSGSAPIGDAKLIYALEYASQSSESAATEYDASYMFGEVGVNVAKFTAKLGYEALGSDDGSYGFATPLATLHKFNGWADQFLNTPAAGLVDTYLSIGYALPVGNVTVVYHDFSSDEGGMDYGTEWDASYGLKFAKSYNAGVKYSKYSADDFSVDTDKLWLWVGASF